MSYKNISFNPIDVRSLSPSSVNLPPRTPPPYLNFIQYIENFLRDAPLFFQQYDTFNSKDPKLVIGSELQIMIMRFNQLIIPLEHFLDVKDDIDNFRKYCFEHYSSPVNLKTFQLSLEMFLKYFENMSQYFPVTLSSNKTQCGLEELFPDFTSNSKLLRNDYYSIPNTYSYYNPSKGVLKFPYFISIIELMKGATLCHMLLFYLI